VSSHILAELEDYSTHMLILSQGRILEHRGIEGAGDNGELRMTLRLARPDDRLAAILAEASNVSDVQTGEDGAGFAIAGGEEAAGALLRVLIEAGLPICAFVPNRANLQDAYLSRMREGDGP
jgi:ABC-2 type transport system ATP-binding protein